MKELRLTAGQAARLACEISAFQRWWVLLMWELLSSWKGWRLGETHQWVCKKKKKRQSQMETVSAFRFKNHFLMCYVDLLLILGTMGQVLCLIPIGSCALSLQSPVVGVGQGVGLYECHWGSSSEEAKGRSAYGKQPVGTWGNHGGGGKQEKDGWPSEPHSEGEGQWKMAGEIAEGSLV